MGGDLLRGKALTNGRAGSTNSTKQPMLNLMLKKESLFNIK
jgi:hypothetical protein